jgi:hypothetical protein
VLGRVDLLEPAAAAVGEYQQLIAILKLAARHTTAVPAALRHRLVRPRLLERHRAARFGHADRDELIDKVYADEERRLALWAELASIDEDGGIDARPAARGRA